MGAYERGDEELYMARTAVTRADRVYGVDIGMVTTRRSGAGEMTKTLAALSGSNHLPQRTGDEDSCLRSMASLQHLTSSSQKRLPVDFPLALN